MSGKSKSEELYDRSSLQLICGICVSLFLLIIVSCTAHKQLKAIVSGETFNFKDSYVQSINIEYVDKGHSRLAKIYMTKEGNDLLYKLYSRHIGQEFSLFFEDRNIVSNLYIAEAARVSSFYFLIENEKDEILVRELMKSYPDAQ